MSDFFNTLSETNRLLKDIDFIFFKTVFPGYSYLPSDIDILIQKKEELDKARKRLLESGFKEIKEVQPFKFRFAKDFEVDLYQKVCWGGVTFLDTVEKKWVEVKGENFPVPSQEDEFLIILAHSFFTMKKVDKFWITYLNDLLKKLDQNKLIHRAKSLGWGDAAKFFMKKKTVKKSNVFLIKKLLFDLRRNKGFIKEITSYLHWRINSFLWRISRR